MWEEGRPNQWHGRGWTQGVEPGVHTGSMVTTDVSDWFWTTNKEDYLLHFCPRSKDAVEYIYSRN